MNGACEQSVIWTSGTDGYHTYRIPAIVVTTGGTILAFCEGRRNGRNDTGDIDMLVKRSEDGGRTWSAQEVVWKDAGNTCGNPCPVVDGETGSVWLLMTHNLGIDQESMIIDETSQGSRTVWVTASGDDGLTWRDPVDITATAKRADWTWYATGPGNGIRLSSGRLLIPCDHIEAGSKRYYSHVIYSDDHGETWKMGGTTSRDQVNECCVAELENGEVLLNTRNYDRDSRIRAPGRSPSAGIPVQRAPFRRHPTDGCCIPDRPPIRHWPCSQAGPSHACTNAGRSTPTKRLRWPCSILTIFWRGQRHDEELIEPICQAALVRYPAQGDRLLFSNPASRESRCNLTVRLSDGTGRSWPHGRVLHPGPSAYSSLAVLSSGTVACLYERGEEHPYETITLALFDIEWLSEV